MIQLPPRVTVVLGSGGAGGWMFHLGVLRALRAEAGFHLGDASRVIATSAGAIAPLIPIPLAIALLLWGLSFAITRYVSIASIVAAVSLPVTAAIQAWRAGQWDWPLLVFTLFLAVMATWRHRSNLKRLREGTESRFEPRKKREGASSSDESAS